MIIWIAVVVPLWFVVLARIPVALSQPRSRPLYWTFLSLAIALTAIRPEPAAWMIQQTDHRSVPDLVKHITGMCAVYFILGWVVAVTPKKLPTEMRLYQRIATGRTRTVITLVAIAVSLVYFPFVASTEVAVREDNLDILMADIAHVPDQAVSQIHNPAGAVPLEIFQGYLAFGMICCALMCMDVWRRDRRSILGIGFCLVAIGCLFGFLYAGLRFSYLAFALCGLVIPTWVLYAGTNTLVTICVPLILIGTSVPMFERFRVAAKERSSIIKLRPLWELVTEAVPRAVLGARPSARRDRWSFGDLHRRLRRRAIEIQDATMALQPYSSASLSRAVIGAANGSNLAFGIVLLVLVAARRKMLDQPLGEDEETTPLLPVRPKRAAIRIEYLEQLSWELAPHHEVPFIQRFESVLPDLDEESKDTIRRILSRRFEVEPTA